MKKIKKFINKMKSLKEKESSVFGILFFLGLSAVVIFSGLMMSGCEALTDKKHQESLIEVVQKTVASSKGFVDVEDNGLIETGFMSFYKWATGNTIGKSKKEILKEYLSIKDAALILENVVEFQHHKTGMSREDLVEQVLHLSGYDKSLDGKIDIMEDREIDMRRKTRLDKMRKASKTIGDLMKLEEEFGSKKGSTKSKK